MTSTGILLLAFVCSVVAVSSETLSEEVRQSAALLNNDFGLDMLKKVCPDGKNTFFSPLSVSIAFAMVSLGARANTLSEIEETFHFNKLIQSNDSYALHKDFENMVTYFSQHHSTFNLTLANRLFSDHQFHMHENFLQDVQNYYKATVQKVNFQGDGVEGIINQWVEEQTHNCIKDLFLPNSIEKDALMILVNAIYFKGSWKIKFEPENTVNATFYATENDTFPVKMMNVVEYFPYTDDADLNVEVLEMPYAGSNMSMVVILPEQGGISELISKLTAEKLKTLLHKLQHQKVKVKFPKFKMELKYYMKNTLKEMGVLELFQKSADLSAMTNESIAVSKVIHKAFVDVSEEGTEAAAATAIEFFTRSGGANRQRFPEFIANRPFVFFITLKDAVHRVVFAGSVSRPPEATA